MKSWSVSSRRFALSLGLLIGLSTPSVVHAGAEEVQACLDAGDIACARTASSGLGRSMGDTLARARLSFHEGDFAAAAAGFEELAPKFGAEPEFKEEIEHVRRTLSATEGFVATDRGDVRIRSLPGLDAVLLDEAFETLQATHDRTGALLGGAPPGGVRVEIYPTGKRFIDASSLPAEAVRTTGVVALSKWTRVLITSPRALGRGYAWRDTVAHEYIHAIVSWRSKDRTPVWLQEGIARALEAHWRTDTPPAMPPFQQGLLAKALATDDFIPLERMHPSIALLPSADEAALAYAQVSTMVWTLQRIAGKDAISRVLDEIGNGVDARQAFADVGAEGDMPRFLEIWKQDLRAQAFIARNLAAMPTVVGPVADDFGIDPVMANRKDIAGKARLGDLLMDAGRPDAALVEFQRALPQDEPPSPVLSGRIAKALQKLDRGDEARGVLETSTADYPEFADTQKLLGESYLSAGRVAEAIARFRASADINPFDPEVQTRLATLYPTVGQAELGRRHARYARLLATGGLATDGEDR